MSGDPVVTVSMALVEGVHLAELVREFRELLAERDVDDAAVRRLTPSAYPDDPESAASFRDATRDEILDRRQSDATVVGAALAPFEADAARATDVDPFSGRDLVIAASDLDPWLRTLTAIRLVIAARLGITTEDPAEDDSADTDGRRDLYDWLGYRLELLIQAADEADRTDG